MWLEKPCATMRKILSVPVRNLTLLLDVEQNDRSVHKFIRVEMHHPCISFGTREASIVLCVYVFIFVLPCERTCLLRSWGGGGERSFCAFCQSWLAAVEGVGPSFSVATQTYGAPFHLSNELHPLAFLQGLNPFFSLFDLVCRFIDLCY